MKKLILMTTFLFISFLSYSQVPANDNCSGAQSLGTLPTPAGCPSGIGTSVNVSGTTINATAPLPYTTLLGCQTGGNQPGPSPDVWYSFVASGNQVNINVTTGTAPFLPSPAITLWTGSCGSLVGFNCDNNGSAGGNNSVTFQPMTPGQTYYIQISSMNAISQGNFNLSVNASNDCNNCLQVANLTVSPAPTNGTYPPNTTVNFCYHISSFTQVSANWLHGVIPTFGCGWDLPTLTTTPATSCSGSGTWGWYPSWTSSANGSTWGPGFAYDYNTSPGNPGNNFGDNCSLPNWNFCWSIKTKAVCSPTCTNLNININTTGDGESGSWTSVACLGDPNYQFAAVMSCCSSTASGVNPTCFGGTNGSVTATPGSTGVPPFTYSWNTVPTQTTQTATNLGAGSYTCTVTDVNGCTSTCNVVITNPPQILTPITQSNVTCFGGSNGSATVTPSGGVGPYTYSWNTVPTQTTQTATNLLSGTYTVTVTSSNGCIKTNTVSITQPTAIVVTTSTTSASCGNSNGSATANPSGGVGPYIYSWNTVPVQTTQTATNIPFGNYTVTVTNSSGCAVTSTVTVPSSGSVSATSTSTSTSCFGSSDGSATANGFGGVTYTYLWNTLQTSQTITGLPAGVYTCTVTSAVCTATTVVTVTQPPIINLTYSTTPLSGCVPLTVTYNNTTPGISNCSWNINGVITNSCNVTQLFTSPGTYNSTLTVTDINGCSNSTGAIVSNAYPIPFVSFSPNPSTTNLLSPTITFDNMSSGGSYFWSFGDGNTSNSQTPTNTYSDTGSYIIKLIVTSQYGCSDSMYSTIHINDILSVYIPNAFTPNGDGKNDSFLPIILGFEKYEYWMFDRWGELIFNTSSGRPWDGTYKGRLAQQDVYICRLIVYDLNKKKYEYTSHVSLIK